jgi:hypothetical protein
MSFDGAGIVDEFTIRSGPTAVGVLGASGVDEVLLDLPNAEGAGV